MKVPLKARMQHFHISVKSAILCQISIKKLNRTHMVDNISSTIKRQLVGLIGKDLTMGFLVTNGDSNMRAGTEQLPLKSIYCMAHLLHIMV